MFGFRFYKNYKTKVWKGFHLVLRKSKKEKKKWKSYHYLNTEVYFLYQYKFYQYYRKWH